jgi:hypothetical protein
MADKWIGHSLSIKLGKDNDEISLLTLFTLPLAPSLALPPKISHCQQVKP